MDTDIFSERQATALRAIKSLYGKPEGEYGPTLFVSHHLQEIEPDHWLRTIGVRQPDADQILSSLADTRRSPQRFASPRSGLQDR
jgi:hypothetical protein